ncbi:MAG TPA: type 4a pilus biogenesis protein PilO [bacterium]|nr:type 4a pilus biogenesis protein PilO [bacterium]
MELKEKDKKMLMFLGIAVVLVLVYYVWSEWLPKIEEVDTKIEKLRKDIDEASKQNILLNEMRYEISVLDNELQNLKRFFPEEEGGNKKVLELMTKMEMLGNKLGVSFSSLSYGAVIEHEGGLFKEVPLTMVLSKPIKLETLIKLLYAFDKYENILDVKQFNINPADEKKELFTVQLGVSFYMFRPETFKI